MIRAHLAAAAAALLPAACATAPSNDGAGDAPVVGVSSTHAGTVRVDGTTSGERVVIGEPTAQAPPSSMVAGTAAGTASSAGTPGTPSGAERGATP